MVTAMKHHTHHPYRHIVRHTGSARIVAFALAGLMPLLGACASTSSAATTSTATPSTTATTTTSASAATTSSPLTAPATTDDPPSVPATTDAAPPTPAPTQPAPASDAPTTSTVAPRLSSTFAANFNQPSQAGPAACTQPTLNCVQTSAYGPLPTTGDWTGTFASGGGNATIGQRMITNGLIQFTGKITGCGTGSVTLASLTVTTPAPLPPQGQPIPFDATPWQIIPGTGTGDLANLTGSGAVSATLDPAFNVKTRYTGLIDCGK